MGRLSHKSYLVDDSVTVQGQGTICCSLPALQAQLTGTFMSPDSRLRDEIGAGRVNQDLRRCKSL
jgi:hypothetical protein